MLVEKLEISFLDMLMDSNGLDILDEQVIHKNNSFVRVRRWLRGRHPELGKIIWGYTGFETIVETDVIRPSGFFEVGGSDAIHGWGFGTYG
jgi:hypothetical protein